MNRRAGILAFALGLVVTLAFAATCAPVAHAQEVRVGAHLLRPDHELLGDPPGVGVSAGFRLHRRVGVRVGGERYARDFQGFGTTCQGLVPAIVDCSAETRDQRARVRALAVWTPVSLFPGERVEANLLPGVLAAWVESHQEGVRSGRMRSADKTMYGYEIGAEIGLRPVTGWPLRLHLGGSLGRLHPSGPERVAEGYAPFEDDFGFGRAQLGVSLVR